jgi:ribose transport system substrate-binding protein
MGRLNWRVVACVAMLALGALALAACGSSSSDTGGSSSSSESSGSAESSGSGGELAAAEKGVEEAKRPAQLNLPGEPLAMKKNAGNTVYYIAASLSIPFISEIAKATTKAGEAAGVKVVTVDGKGKADVFNQAVSTAVSQNASGIILHAIDPSIVSGPLAEAKKAGIPVVDMFNRGPTTALPSTVGAQITLDYPQSGRTMANYIAADSGGSGKVGVITWGIYEIYQEMVPAFEEELEKNCPGCELETVKNVSPTGPATELQNLTTQMLRQYPEMEYVAPVSDALALEVLPAVEAAGRPVKVVSADGSTAGLEALETGEPFVADVSDPPLESVGWSVMDQVGRLMAGQKPSKEDADLPTQLFTGGEVPPLEERWPGFEGFEAKFEKLWGLG